MYFIFKALARTLILPPAGPLLLAIAGVLLILRKKNRSGWTALALGLGALWLFATPLIADALSRVAEHYEPLDPSQELHAQAIVILGGGGQRIAAPEYGGPAAEPMLLERLSYGAFIAHRSHLPILVTGLAEEATTMRASLARDFGLQVRWFENRSHDTYENAQLSARLLRADGINKIILVTSGTHLFRATQEFESAGIQVTPAPAGVWAPRELGIFRYVPSAGGLMRSQIALYELMGEPVRRVLAMLHLREHFDRPH